MRTRLSNERHPQRPYSYLRRADEYDMNVERQQPSLDKYQRGNPSDWAEDRYPSDAWMGEEVRNEMNLPVVAPIPGAMQFPIARRRSGLPVNANKDVHAMRRKALRCVKLAKHLLGEDAKEKDVEDQAVVLMNLDDSAILSSLSRVRKASKKVAEDDKPEGQEPAPEGQEAAPEGQESDSIPMDMDSLTDDLLDDDFDDGAMGNEDQFMDDLLGDEGDINIELETQPMTEDELPIRKLHDQVLQNLFDPQTGEVTARKSSKPQKKGVQKLGGGLKKTANASSSNLSALWKSDPDVSDVFKD